MDIQQSTGTSIFSDLWGSLEFIEFREFKDRIEVIYKQTSNVMLTIYPPQLPAQRAIKIIFSCVDGKWNKSEPIFGNVIPPQRESYEFDEN